MFLLTLHVAGTLRDLASAVRTLHVAKTMQKPSFPVIQPFMACTFQNPFSTTFGI